MRTFILLLLITSAIAVHAIVAHPSPATITQPDGSTIEIMLHGDEYLSFSTTTDGFTILKDCDGFMKYAILENDTLVSSTFIAHNPYQRTETELSFLAKTAQYVIPEVKRNAAKAARSNDSGTQPMSKTPLYDYDNFRGLVILVEFNDCKFSRDDMTDIFTDMITKPNYDGFTSQTGEKIEYTGSVRDYFYSNSMGRFNPHFDVVGPVTVDYSQTYPCSTENNHILIPAALRAADTLVDYSLFDTDGDNVVEMVYFIFAGAGANYAGNDSRYLWPHAAQVASSMNLDGVKFKRYACSTEFYGQEKDQIIDGIGTICHEFSHVLGLPDLYDTDYATNGLSTSPEDWSVMAGGSYLNFARTPCCYSLYERYAVSTLSTIGLSNHGYRINSNIPDEYFLLENRQNTGWDKHLPGHGLIVFRVDSTNVEVWEKNKVNAYSNRNYYELLRACPTYNDKNAIIDSPGDPFPGTGNITSLTNTTIPSLRSWTGMETGFILTDIAELPDGQISFTAKKDDPETLYEDFESCAVTDGTQSEISGKFCTWTLRNGAKIESITSLNEGTRSVATTMSASLTTSDIPHEIDFITADFYNPTNYLTSMICQYSEDNGLTWRTLNTINNDEQVRLTAKTNTHVTFKAQTPKHCQYRFTESIGNKTSYIDNITFILDKQHMSSTGSIQYPHNQALNVTISGPELRITSTDNTTIHIYSIDGRSISTIIPDNGFASTSLPSRGIYIIRQGTNAIKILY